MILEHCGIVHSNKLLEYIWYMLLEHCAFKYAPGVYLVCASGALCIQICSWNIFGISAPGELCIQICSRGMFDLEHYMCTSDYLCSKSMLLPEHNFRAKISQKHSEARVYNIPLLFCTVPAPASMGWGSTWGQKEQKIAGQESKKCM